MDKTSKPLFKIDFNTWRLPKNPETGLPIEPVPSENFNKYEYWSDTFNQPIRQVIPKNGRPLYADYLNLDTITLRRKVSSLLGVSAYDDEISKDEYEALCQTALLRHHYQKQINYEALLPFQTLALTFLRFQEKVLILKTQQLYTVNYKEKKLERISLNPRDILDKSEKISEHEFYYAIIKELIELNGMEFLSI